MLPQPDTLPRILCILRNHQEITWNKCFIKVSLTWNHSNDLNTVNIQTNSGGLKNFDSAGASTFLALFADNLPNMLVLTSTDETLRPLIDATLTTEINMQGLPLPFTKPFANYDTKWTPIEATIFKLFCSALLHITHQVGKLSSWSNLYYLSRSWRTN